MPEIIQLSTDNEKLQAATAAAAAALGRGGVILYPTDTVYGLGADATNPDAVERIYAIKGRREEQRLLVMVDSLKRAQAYGALDEVSSAIARHFWPGPISLIAPRTPEAPAAFLPQYETIGFRVPDNAFCLRLVRSFGKPITSTSANLSGKPPRQSVDEIFADMDATLIDVIIDAGVLPEQVPSTIVRAYRGNIEILREGAISRERIESVLHKESYN